MNEYVQLVVRSWCRQWKISTCSMSKLSVCRFSWESGSSSLRTTTSALLSRMYTSKVKADLLYALQTDRQ